MTRQTRQTPALPRYRCVHCQRLLERASTKRWVKSYCDRAGRLVHLQRQERGR